jgi:hypothetical protein
MAQENMIKLHYLFHFLMYYIAWFTGIELAAHGAGLSAFLFIMLISLLQIGWQFKICKKTHGLFYFILILTLIGSLLDTVFIQIGIIRFSSNLFSPYLTAPWMIAIWISFAILLYSVLNNLLTRYFLMGVLALAGFPIAYAAGAKMGAALFPYGYVSCIIVGVTWGIFLPTCLYFYNWIIK